MKRIRLWKAYTLLELLIVMSIILILASIAVVNLLEAQTRARVSRAMADMRSLAVALEAYNTDHGHYPIPFPHIPDRLDNNTGDKIPNTLSSPVAYVANANSFIDPFAFEQQSKYGMDMARYGLITTTIKTHAAFDPPPAGLSYLARVQIGSWRLDSLGPDQLSMDWPNEHSYDPTNGSVSRGDVYRTQIDGAGNRF